MGLESSSLSLTDRVERLRSGEKGTRNKTCDSMQNTKIEVTTTANVMKANT